MKKLISLLLIISFLGLHCAWYERGEGINLEPSQQPGVNLIFWKLDWKQVKGELIAVKENSLLLKELGTGVDVSVDITNIRTITIVKNSNLLSGIGFGLIIGAGFGAIIGWGGTDESGSSSILYSSNAAENIRAYGILFGLIGAAVGGITGAIAGTDKTIQIEGKSEAEIKTILEDLRKIARVPDFR
jgi:hypothetical protein